MTQDMTLLSPYEIKAGELKQKAEALVVDSPEAIKVANALFKECQETLRDIRAKRDEIVKPVEAQIDEIKNLAKATSLPVEEAKTMIEEKALAWKAEQERLRQEEAEKERKRFEEIRLKQEAEARERALKEKAEREAEEARLAKIRAEQEEERRKLEAEKDEARKKEREIEQKRLDEERKLEEERVRIAQEKRKNEEEKQRLEEEKARMAEEKRIEAERVEREKKDAEAAKLRGLTSYWKFEVVDEAALDRKYMMPNSAKINEDIKAGVRVIPGLRIYEEQKMK